MGFFFDGSLFFVMFYLIFFLVLATFVVTAVRGIAQWSRNNASPLLTVPARVVAKRTRVGRNGTHNTGYHTYTRYYVTFQVESGDRMELNVPGEEYGLLVEGDEGTLSFQGTRYKGFERRH